MIAELSLFKAATIAASFAASLWWLALFYCLMVALQRGARSVAAALALILISKSVFLLAWFGRILLQDFVWLIVGRAADCMVNLGLLVLTISIIQIILTARRSTPDDQTNNPTPSSTGTPPSTLHRAMLIIAGLVTLGIVFASAFYAGSNYAAIKQMNYGSPWKSEVVILDRPPLDQLLPEMLPELLFSMTPNSYEQKESAHRSTKRPTHWEEVLTWTNHVPAARFEHSALYSNAPAAN